MSVERQGRGPPRTHPSVHWSPVPQLEQEMMNLSAEALVDLARFVSDAQAEVQRAKNQAIHQPWRR